MTHKAVKVMSFNISSGRRMDGELDLKLTAKAIEEGGAAVVGLQEVDRNFSDRSSFLDQAKWLSERLDMEMAYGPNLIHRTGRKEQSEREYGNATLSRYPIQSSTNHDLSSVEEHPEDFEPRGLLEAMIDADGFCFSFYNTHLSLTDKEVERNLTEILVLTRENPLPKVLVGDFNASPESEHIQRFTRHFHNAFGETGPYPETYKMEGDHGKKIDYIFHDPHFSAEDTWTVSSEASDHVPIAVELKYLQKNNNP
ncbi:endonuclease/exonuclease/phosphatase family protein [Planococcus sp. ISL-109]|uniref:endonuclease/exonuclease/phosphatase family protein n=1 Tax=Planococcus sp. ISL-109 TaxID=2819166 RepID=UPI001BEA0F00|nr:endonuclease/exonuclease/phosphatase family protein [Planococcus sp. ISL-109]MBT2581502.1 endonuclease/exonuclease/phosphatase family protein [Planococcus sp. ISL-109]